MGHDGMSSLLVLLLPLLLTSLQATAAARVPAQNTAESVILDMVCDLEIPFDKETASVIQAKLRESPGFPQFEDAMKDDETLVIFLDEFCDYSAVTTNSTTNTTTDPTPTITEEDSTPTITEEDSTPTITEEDSTPTITEEDSTPTITEEDSTPTITEEDSTPTSSTETPPLEGVELYTKTYNELDEINTILDDFIALVETQPEAAHVESVVSARRVWDGRDLPVAWWQRRKSSRPRADIVFCTDGPCETCNTLETQLEATDELVVQLTDDVDAWQDSDLTELTEVREGLEDTYEEAKKDESGFADCTDDQFLEAVRSVKENVESGASAVEEKIDELNIDNSGSVALVATLGSVGGLMVVGLIGVAIYGAVQKSSAKKKRSPAKAKQEDIPIDAYAHDGPGYRPPPKMDPYSPAPVPAPRNYHHPGQFDPRREPVYPEPINGRPQQGLRRTNY